MSTALPRKCEPRRRTPGKLGAVRKAKTDEVPPGSLTRADAATNLFPDEEDAATSSGLELSPRARPSLGPPGPQDHETESWLDREIAGAAARERSPRALRPGQAAQEPVAVQSAASQVVNRALQTFGLDEGAAPRRASAAAFRQETSSILDRGMEAINGVSRLMEGFALTLDSVIEKAFEDWGTPGLTKAGRATSPATSTSSHSNEGDERAVPVKAPSARTLGAISPSVSTAVRLVSPPGPARGTSAPARAPEPADEAEDWRGRAEALGAELAQLKAKQDQLQDIEIEERRLKDERVALTRTASPDAHARRIPTQKVDSEAIEQVTDQLQLLLAEKARLAQDNARLIRENNGLQELLEFTMAAQGQADDLGDDFLGDELELR